MRGCVTGSDDLRDIVNRAAQDATGLCCIESEMPQQRRIQDHSDRAVGGDTGNHDYGIALRIFAGPRHGDRHGRRGATDSNSAPGEHAETAVELQGTGHQHPEADGRRHGDQHHRRRRPAQLADLREGDAQPQQGDTDPQQDAGGEIDAGAIARLG